MNHIIDNIAQIRKRISKASLGAGRNPEEVKLLLATKTVSAQNIKIALEAGERLIGENKAQELKSKYDDLLGVPHQKHFIGHLQTNKIKELLRYDVTCIQSIDRLDLIKQLKHYSLLGIKIQKSRKLLL